MSDLTIGPHGAGIGRLFEEVRDAVIVAEAATGRIVLWNQGATQIFGYSPSDALEPSVEMLVPERLRARHRMGLSRYEASGHGPYIDSGTLLELPAVRKGGEEIRIEMSLSSMTPDGDLGEVDERFVIAIVRDVTDLALGLRAIAEGVETEEHLRRVRELGCDLAQAYHFSRPLPGDAAGALLENRTL